MNGAHEILLQLKNSFTIAMKTGYQNLSLAIEQVAYVKFDKYAKHIGTFHLVS